MKKHELTNISEINRTATCKSCGFVSISWRNDHKIWRCEQTVYRRKSRDFRKHFLTHICEKSKTAYCENCSLVGIRKNYNSWLCNRTNRGVHGRQIDKFRKIKKMYCEKCGWKAQHLCQIDIHHINENHKDDRLENLASYCKPCHRLYHFKSDEQLKQERIDRIQKHRVDLQSQDIQISQEDLLVKIKPAEIHNLTEICLKSKTAICAKCGLIRINKRKHINEIIWCCRTTNNIAKNGIKYSRNKQREFSQSVKKDTYEKCGFKAENLCQIDIHHADGNYENNELSNLKSWCGRCHSFEHVADIEKFDDERIARLLNKRWLILLQEEEDVKSEVSCVDDSNVFKEIIGITVP